MKRHDWTPARAFARAHDAAHGLRNEDDGLTLVAYAIGAAAVITPLAIVVFAFGTDATSEAQNRVNEILPSAPATP